MSESSDASSTAKEMAARFTGPDGHRLLHDLIRRQALTEGKLDVVDQVVAVAKIESYEAGEMIIRQGGTDTDIFFILCGSVRININGRDDAERPAGTHIGEMAAIDPAAQRSITILASAPTIVARVNEPDFSAVAAAHPFIWRHLARELADRLRLRVAKVPIRKPKPRVFIASSSEGLKNAKALQMAFCDDHFEVKVWADGIFTPGLTNIEALEAELLRTDFAVLLLSPDDEVKSRGVISEAPRDNLILELGLFAGKIGRKRAIMVCPHDVDLKLPTDFLGVNPIKYSPTDMATVATELCMIFRSLGSK